jgi:hypothetical protein
MGISQRRLALPRAVRERLGVREVAGGVPSLEVHLVKDDVQVAAHPRAYSTNGPPVLPRL